MIVLSVGMPRAGSGWYYNLTNDLMLASGAQEARRIREQFHLQRILTEVNCNIGALTPWRLMAVLAPSILGNTFVIKAHAGPTPFALHMIRIGLIRPTYIYRDPRDAMLSALENGKRARERGLENAFSRLVDFDTALDFMMDYVHIWNKWMRCSEALHVRYEDLLNDYNLEVERLATFLQLESDDPALQSSIARYRPENAQPDQIGLHYSKGKIGRFRQEMSLEQQEILADRFGSVLAHRGYEI
jgi:hypothetical protein